MPRPLQTLLTAAQHRRMAELARKTAGRTQGPTAAETERLAKAHEQVAAMIEVRERAIQKRS